MARRLGIFAALTVLSAVATHAMAKTDIPDRASLIATIEANGQNEFQDRRHAIQVEDCTMITFFWKDLPEEGWTLWSSFSFSMLQGDLSVSDNRDGETRYFAYAPGPENQPEKAIAIIPFEMVEGTFAQHERSNFREMNDTARPSPRGDGTTHHFHDISKFFIMHSGPGVVEKAQAFTQSYRTYVQHYCTFTG